MDLRSGRANEPHDQGATVKVLHYDDLESLKAHVVAFATAYNFAKHLKALRWRTPYQVICEPWTKDPSIFKIDPHHLIPGPHNDGIRNELARPLGIHASGPARTTGREEVGRDLKLSAWY